MSKANKLPLKKNPSRVIQPMETKNRYSPLGTEVTPTEKENTRTDSPNRKITAKQNAINTATQNIQNSNDKTESDTPDKRKLPVTAILGDSMVKDIKRWKMSTRTRKVVMKHFSGAQTKDMNPYVIPTVAQKPDNIILHTGTNDLESIDNKNDRKLEKTIRQWCKSRSNLYGPFKSF